MFDQMLDSSPFRRRQRNPWAFGISLFIQSFAIGLLLLVPLLYTEALPTTMELSWLAAPPPPPPPPPPPAAAPVRAIRRVTLMEGGKLRAPTHIPKEIAMIKEDPLPEDYGGVVGGVPGGVPGGQIGGVIGGVIGGIPSPAAPPPQQRLRVSSGVQAAKRIAAHYVQPSYPTLAKTARIQGTVRLQAIIAKDGTIQALQVIDGHMLLVEEAKRAVLRWRYEPTLLNGVPVEVETIIDVIFKLY